MNHPKTKKADFLWEMVHMSYDVACEPDPRQLMYLSHLISRERICEKRFNESKGDIMDLKKEQDYIKGFMKALTDEEFMLMLEECGNNIILPTQEIQQYLSKDGYYEEKL